MKKWLWIMMVVGILSLCSCGQAGKDAKISDSIMLEESPQITEPDEVAQRTSVDSVQEETNTEEQAIVAEPNQTETIFPAEVPRSTMPEGYELVYEGMNLFTHLNTTYFKQNIGADLYRRRLQDDAGEYMELSLWTEHGELWHTIARDDIEPCYPFWKEGYSENLTLEKRQCYYVVELDGNAYLMHYHVENVSNMVTMTYKVFGLSVLSDYSQGYAVPYDAGSISIYLTKDESVASSVSFPIEQMTAFADTVRGYMEKGQLVAATLHGAFELDASADRDNSIAPYLYDIFPWIPEMVAQHGINMEDIHSTKELLAALQNALPAEPSVNMPDVATGGSFFITGNYYSSGDRSYLTVSMREDGSYEGGFYVDNLLMLNYTGSYQNGILTAVETTDDMPYEMEISFQNGEATVVLTAVEEPSYAEVGDTLTLDRNEKPVEFDYLRNYEVARLNQLSIEEQIDLIVKQKALWQEGMDYANERQQYTVADMNGNGRLELIASNCGGTGNYSYSRFYEVNRDYNGLVLCETDFQEGHSQPDLVDYPVMSVYMDDVGKCYYLCEDMLHDGADYYYTDFALSMEKNGKVTATPLAMNLVRYGDEESPTYHYRDGEGKEISQEQYQSIISGTFANAFRKYIVNWNWLDKAVVDAADEQALTELLLNAYEAITWTSQEELQQYGTWEIIGLAGFAGASALSAEEAQGYIGKQLIYARDAFTYENSTMNLSKSGYGMEIFSREDWLDSFHITTLETALPEEIFMCSVLTEGNHFGSYFAMLGIDRLLIRYEGAFFVAERVTE